MPLPPGSPATICQIGRWRTFRVKNQPIGYRPSTGVSDLTRRPQ
jgi:hypothetical protein